MQALTARGSALPPTLGTVVGLKQLALRVLTCEDDLGRQVRWVATSELEDPTPFLEGGELLLTTGMRLGADPEAVQAYVDRLAGGGVVGLGFGVGLGLGHESVPEELVRAAKARGLVLLEVPRPTPFIAIGKAVSDLLAAERYEAVTRAFEAQRELTHAALRPERSGAVVAHLAREVDGWALLLDPGGSVMHAAPALAARHAAELAGEIDRLRGKGLLASSTLTSRGEHVMVQPLGVEGRVRGFLAVGGEHPFSALERTIVGAAVSLLSLELEAPRAQVKAERLLRTALVHLLLEGELDAAGPIAELVNGGLPDEPVRAVAVDCAGATREAARGALLDALEDDPALRAGRCLVAEVDERVLVVAPETPALIDVTARLAEAEQARVGVGDPVGLGTLRRTLTEAEQALAAGHRMGRSVTRYADLAGAGLLSLLDSAAVRGFATVLLDPLVRYSERSRADLIASLRAYLRRGGRWDAAAEELGVHRHTLRYRMRRVEELLGRDLDSVETRTELWVALQVLGYG